jgi:DNA gyrase subunit B
VEKARFDKMISSEEIRTMITALGTGIGEEEYKIDSLRYHKVIIMTDADVDGSHIRTLLLTFFYRQMPELIERGHLYVAQPPLYRILAGKKELYIKDEEGLNQHLLKRISEKEKVCLENGEEISNAKLMNLLNSAIRFYESIERLSKRGYNRRLVESLVSAGPKDKTAFKNKEFMDTLFMKLQKDNFEVRDIQLSEQGGYYEFSVNESLNGGHTTTVNWEFFSSPELKQILGISKQLGKLSKSTFIIKADAQEEKFDDLQQLLESLMGRAKKGLAIQRYKGLGEMNPTQLWTTTMDPEKRTLLKVRIEDVLEADDIFTILMGDKVEPRREFIQSNALEVTELDI